MHQALARQQARARLTLCQCLDVDPRDARLMDAMTWLVGDDPLRVAQDVDTIARWHRAQGLPEDTGDIRQRLAQRLEAIARRQGAGADDQGRSGHVSGVQHEDGDA